MTNIIGIDFSGFGSRVATLIGGRPTIILNGQDDGAFSQRTCAQRLRQLKASAEDYLGQTVSEAAVAVPDCFNTVQRQALLRAAESVSLKVKRLLNETTAAALVYSGGSKTGNILVCGLSGSTLNVSAIMLDEDVLDVLACAGSERLDGNAARPVEATEKVVLQVMKDAGLKPEDLSGVLLVKDAGRIPGMRDMICRCTGQQPVRGVSPDDCVAQGAAIMGGIRNGALAGPLALELLTQPLRVETPDGTVTGLYPKGLPTIPSQVVIDYSQDGGAGGELHLFQGERAVGRYPLRDLIPAGLENQPVGVAFHVDVNGIVTVSAAKPTGGQKKKTAAPKTDAPGPSPSPAKPVDPVAVIQSFFPVYDNLERALRQDTADTAYKKGVEMTMNQMKEVFAKLGVTEIEAMGKPFDPNLHNAVMHVEDENLGENTVAQVFQAGFMLGEKVIRFAMVQVAN